MRTFESVGDGARREEGNVHWPPLRSRIRPSYPQILEYPDNQRLHHASIQCLQWAGEGREDEVDLLSRLVGRVSLVLDQVPEDLVLVLLHHVRDASVSERKETTRVPHGGVAEGTGDAQLSEVGQFLLDDLHAAPDVPCSHVGETVHLRHDDDDES